ncbi:hypothetical protein BU17DRAFT_85360 [Hysterangium stoloniferum]|nr:hypothetical protein BU17DRAFT_85360 [Hysterangium stoloniferum]
MAAHMKSSELKVVGHVFPFDNLVFDVQSYILLAFLSPGDLYSLTLVSRNINVLARPILYRHVRLLPGLKLRSRGSHAEGTLTKTLMSSQLSFGQEVLAHPSRALDVRHLEWQMCSFEDTYGHVLLDVFPTLRNVGVIHLIDAHPTTMAELNLVVPTLFPRVRDVTLRGVTYFPFITPILHSPHQLSALSLDTVSPHFVNVRLLQWITASNLPALKRLSFRTACALDPKREDETLEGWKDALFSVQDTITEIVLGLTSQPARPISDDEQRRFSTKFITVVQPVFFHSRWPRLEQVKLEGIDIDSVDASSPSHRLKRMVPKLIVDSTIPQAQRIWKSETLGAC